MKLPTNAHVWLGMALVLGILFLGLGGTIAALKGQGPTDGMITAVSTLLSTLAGGLIGGAAGYAVGKGSGGGTGDS